MNGKKILVIITFLIFSFALELQATYYPTNCTISAQNIVIPWNQSSANVTISISYYNYTIQTESALEYVKLNGNSCTLGSGNRPTTASYTVFTAGTYEIEAQMIYYDGGTYHYTYAYTNVIVTKEQAPILPPEITSDSYSSNQWVHFVWSSVQGAVSYNVYRTGQIQGTLSEGVNNVGNTTNVYDYPYEYPTFSTFVPTSFGFASYYVTAVNSNGIESYPSNSVTWGVW